PGKHVFSISLRPSRLQEAYTFDAPLQERSEGEVLSYQYTRTESGREIELLLYSQKVIPGQSGSPVISDESGEAVGFIEGRWWQRLFRPKRFRGERFSSTPRLTRGERSRTSGSSRASHHFSRKCWARYKRGRSCPHAKTATMWKLELESSSSSRSPICPNSRRGCTNIRKPERTPKIAGRCPSTHWSRNIPRIAWEKEAWFSTRS